ncbi:50S ribosomal protein L19 [Candidatus Peribacteria bacterium RIFCSPHIGHO2_01_FULL_51_35]|nr:MAG: 50S ribosomal protein L19 [Candidatus Peribacteria bacterium RIFCSPHIGHO2_01_FULL_51_35]
MPSQLLHDEAKKYVKNRPALVPGATVRVHEKIQEGEKQRVQIFEGLVIGMHKGHVSTDRSFTVRKIASGVGVERVFPLHSPLIEKIEVKKIAKVRRAKLNFLRGRKGKSARLSERFTTDDEFAIAVQAEAPVAAKEEEIIQAPAEEKKKEKKAE